MKGRARPQAWLATSIPRTPTSHGNSGSRGRSRERAAARILRTALPANIPPPRHGNSGSRGRNRSRERAAARVLRIAAAARLRELAAERASRSREQPQPQARQRPAAAAHGESLQRSTAARPSSSAAHDES